MATSHGSQRSKWRKEGYLHKRGGRIQTWHKRWFTLKGDILFYYRTSADSKPLGNIPLAGNKLIKNPPDDPKIPGQHRFEITAGNTGQLITPSHESFLLYAENLDDLRSWITTICNVMYEPYCGAMFGRSLTDTVALEKKYGGGGYIPAIVHKCCRYVQEKGLEEVGIFRLPGSTTRVNELKDLFNEGQQLEFPTHLGEDVHTVASLFKLYIRELPEPVVDHYNYRKVIDATKAYDIDVENGLTVLRETLELLPRANYNLLKYISRFLHDVQSHASVNKMVSSNLGTVFGPNMLRPESDDPQELVSSSHMLTRFVVIVIDAQEQLFSYKPEEEILPEKLVPEARPTSPAGTLSRKESWTSSVYDQGGLDKVATLRNVKKLPDKSRRTVSMVEERNNLIDLSGEENPPKYPDLAISRRLQSTGSPIPSDGMFNHLLADVEGMQKEIARLNAQVVKERRAGKLWKKRYEQEKTARETMEQRAEELRFVLDETFKNFDVNYEDTIKEDIEEDTDEVSEL